ncbi:MAG: DUF3344 domain-containing protein [Methanophagales archaeon]|nr:DUF3344 domain-containing protein [Methanophagales archaeon]
MNTRMKSISVIALVSVLILFAVSVALAMANGKPDLVILEIKPDCGYLFGNENNTISAVVENIDDADAGASHARFVLSDGYSETVAVPALAAGTNVTVTITDPTERNAGASVTITVTADCNDVVTESNETNNTKTLSKTVVNNGYKGKRYTGGEDITTWKTFELNGNLVYSVGDSYYLSGYYGWPTASYTATWIMSNLSVPAGATIEEARLYVPYCFDYQDDMPDNLVLKFNENAQTLEKHYTDRKSHGSWNYPYGMLAYDVTDDFDTSGNIATLTNLNPKCCEQKTVSIRGMLLVVIYEDASEPRRQIYVNEEFDMLYGGSYKCTTPEEATAWAPLVAIAPTMASPLNARLITVAPGAGPNEGDLLFNGHVWTDVWNFAGNTQIGIDERIDVTFYLESTDNLVGFQSSKDWMEASNAFLVVESAESAGVTFDKKKLNLNSKGILKAFITPPDGYDVADIDVSTVECEDAPAFGDGSVIPGKNALEVKFKIQDLDVLAGSAVTLRVIGTLTDGTAFQGSNTLKVV